MKVELVVNTDDYTPLGPMVPEVQKKGLQYTANYLIERLQVNSPIDTGYLKGWHIHEHTDSMVDVRSPAKYAIYQDQGTGVYAGKGKITAKKPGGVLHWEKGGTHYFAKSVKGVRGKRFVEKSVSATKGRLDSFFIKAIQEAL
ncbi:MAG: HK97 gp10 family phage protein [Methanobrevibacter sp.]|nr:HK97 gp10 family phage protein [Methanobrevibacter sp.]